jgi:hypothetical protein
MPVPAEFIPLIHLLQEISSPVKSFRQIFRPIYAVPALVPVLAGIAFWFVRRRKRRQREDLIARTQEVALLTGEITGLSADEATASICAQAETSIKSSEATPSRYSTSV